MYCTLFRDGTLQIGYYRKFVHGYGSIIAPTQEKKNPLNGGGGHPSICNIEGSHGDPPMLTLPDFSKMFLIERDAFGNGLGIVLMQEGRPLAYFKSSIKM